MHTSIEYGQRLQGYVSGEQQNKKPTVCTCASFCCVKIKLVRFKFVFGEMVQNSYPRPLVVNLSKSFYYYPHSSGRAVSKSKHLFHLSP